MNKIYCPRVVFLSSLVALLAAGCQQNDLTDHRSTLPDSSPIYLSTDYPDDEAFSYDETTWWTLECRLESIDSDGVLTVSESGRVRSFRLDGVRSMVSPTTYFQDEARRLRDAFLFLYIHRSIEKREVECADAWFKDAEGSDWINLSVHLIRGGFLEHQETMRRIHAADLYKEREKAQNAAQNDSLGVWADFE